MGEFNLSNVYEYPNVVVSDRYSDRCNHPESENTEQRECQLFNGSNIFI